MPATDRQQRRSDVRWALWVGLGALAGAAVVGAVALALAAWWHRQAGGTRPIEEVEAPTPAPAPVTARSAPATGRQGPQLGGVYRLKGGGGSVLVCKDLASHHEAHRRAAARDDVGAAKMLESGRAYFVREGTPARVTALHHRGVVTVRLLGGWAKGGEAVCDASDLGERAEEPEPTP